MRPSTRIESWLSGDSFPTPYSVRETQLKAPTRVFLKLISRKTICQIVGNEINPLTNWRSIFEIPKFLYFPKSKMRIELAWNTKTAEPFALKSNLRKVASLTDPITDPFVINKLNNINDDCEFFEGILQPPRNFNLREHEYDLKRITSFFWKLVSTCPHPLRLDTEINEQWLHYLNDQIISQEYKAVTLLRIDINHVTAKKEQLESLQACEINAFEDSNCSTVGHLRRYSKISWKGNKADESRPADLMILNSLARLNNNIITICADSKGTNFDTEDPITEALLSIFDWESAMKCALIESMATFVNGPIRYCEGESLAQTLDTTTVMKNAFAAVIDTTVMNVVFYFLDFARNVYKKHNIDLTDQAGWRKLANADANLFKKIADEQLEITQIKVENGQQFYKCYNLYHPRPKGKTIVTEDGTNWLNLTSFLKWFRHIGCNAQARFMVDNLIQSCARLLKSDTSDDVDKEIQSRITAKAIAIVHSLTQDVRKTTQSQGFLITHPWIMEMILTNSSAEEVQNLINEGATSLVFSLMKIHVTYHNVASPRILLSGEKLTLAELVEMAKNTKASVGFSDFSSINDARFLLAHYYENIKDWLNADASKSLRREVMNLLKSKEEETYMHSSTEFSR